MSGGRAHPARATAALSVALASVAVGGVLGGRVLGHPTLTLSDAPIAFYAVALGFSFCLGEMVELHVEFRRQALTVTMASLPLVVGAVILPVDQLVLVRILGAAAYLLVQRLPAAKVVYNLSSYAAEAAVVGAFVQLVTQAMGGLTATTAIIIYVLVVAVDQVATWCILRVIGWHGGQPPLRPVAEFYLPAAVISAISTTAAFAILMLLTHGWLGVLVLVIFGVTTAMVYRAFRAMHRGHRALQQVHDFVATKVELTQGHDTGLGMLSELRARMQASRAEMLLRRTGDAGYLLLTADESGHTAAVPVPGLPDSDELVRAAVTDHVSTYVPRDGRTGEHRAWLGSRVAREGIVVPLPPSEFSGAVVVLDRTGASGPFTVDDQATLQTLAGHLAVALRNSELVDRLRFDATHDALTGLSNRAVLEFAVTAALAAGERVGVIVADLDRFKDVNDTLGHPVGDDLLVATAGRLVDALPPGSVVARLGGDEFAALVHPVADEAAVIRLAAATRAVVGETVEIGEVILSIAASFGTTTAVAADQVCATDLLRHADTAMYAAKDDHQPVVAYTPELDRGRAERLSLQADLRLALERDELAALYQPKVDLATDRVDSAEALVRWEHPRLGPLSPTAFVPLAEVNGLIGPLTRVILGKALAQAAEWRRQGLRIAVAVNLSAVVVNDPALPRIVAEALLDADVPPEALILEVTESSVIDDPELAVSVLQRIADTGVCISLDDFGTGYSSLSYLQRLPVSEVKIDQSFVRRLVEEHEPTGTARLLVESVIGLCHGLGHRVVAEGVEDEQTTNLLASLGCDLVQGFGVSRPDTGALVAAFARSRPRGSARVLHLAT